MKEAYPVILTRTERLIVVYIPDFDINTQGGNYAEALAMARDAIGLVGIDMQDDGLPIPAASAMSDLVLDSSASIVSLVDIDFDEYRRKTDLRMVRKNCTIPSWLNFEAERAGLNFSALLQSAIKSALHIED